MSCPSNPCAGPYSRPVAYYTAIAALSTRRFVPPPRSIASRLTRISGQGAAGRPGRCRHTSPTRYGLDAAGVTGTVGAAFDRQLCRQIPLSPDGLFSARFPQLTTGYLVADKHRSPSDSFCPAPGPTGIAKSPDTHSTPRPDSSQPKLQSQQTAAEKPAHQQPRPPLKHHLERKRKPVTLRAPSLSTRRNQSRHTNPAR